MRLFRDICKADLAGMAGAAAAVTLLMGCAQQRAAPVTSPYGAASISAPQIGNPAVGSSASFSAAAIVGAGSFPRSFLIPGTDTSIRLGG
jgi:hypothetical protein